MPNRSAPAEMRRAAEFQPASYNAADNSLELVWSVGAAGTRFDWLDGGFYIESLSMEPGAIRLERLNAGACLLDSHATRSLASVLGSVVPGSARVEGGQGLARVRLASTPDVADTNQKIIYGHIRNVSVAYHVHKFERTETPGETPKMHAIDWEPVEISMVTVPFDAAAQVRSAGDVMPEIIETQTDDTPTPRSRQRTAVTEAIIRERCSRSDDLPRAFERRLIEMHGEEPLSRRELDALIADELVAARSSPSIDPRAGRRPEREVAQRDAFADALYARLSGREPSEAARPYAGVSMVDMARGLLEQRGEHVRWHRPAAVIDALSRSGLHTIADFAAILNSAGRRYLIDAYVAAASPLRQLARKRDFPDFRRRYGIQADGPSVLRTVPEAGEFRRVSIGESKNGAQLSTYGEIFSITRQALVNDDLGVFSQMATFWARAQAGTEANFFTALIAGDGTPMEEDGKTLFHADHGNKAASGGAINVTTLSAGRLAMRTVKNRDGSMGGGVVPKYLVVGPAKETEAEQTLAVINASQPSETNPFSGKLELVVDNLQTGNSWRLFADPAVNPVLEYGNLEGQDGLFTDTRIGFDVDGVDFKARTDIGAAAIDYRGAYLNPGN